MIGYMTNHLPSFTDEPFMELAPGVGTGYAPNRAWQALSTVPLAILVGVTGVGKSTTLQRMQSNGFAFQLLPDRRELTDQLIITFLQRQAGETPHQVTDRMERFALTRRYREQFPGGMSHALSRILVLTANAPNAIATTVADVVEARQARAELHPWWLFDGLRGANEVQAAAELLPAARFIVLDAPDVVRVERLLGRSDRFDQVRLQPADDSPKATAQNFAAIGVREADGLFTAEECTTLFALCQPPLGQGDIAVDDLRAKLKIVAEERRNYDPSLAWQTLEQIAPHRTLLIDTTKLNATAAAVHIGDWLDQPRDN